MFTPDKNGQSLIAFAFGVFLLLFSSQILAFSSKQFDHERMLVYEDSTLELKFDQILKIPVGEFNQIDGPSVNFGFTKSAYWFFFTLENSTLETKRYYLEISYPIINEIDFYDISRGKLRQHIETGEFHSFYSRPIKHNYFVFPLILRPYEKHQYLVRVYNYGETLRVPFRILHEEQIMEQTNMVIFKGLFYGLLLMVFVLNVFLYTTIKDRLYLFFGLYVIFLALFMANIDGLSFHYFWPNSSLWADRSTTLFAALGNLFLLWFSKQYLDLKAKDRIYKIVFNIFIIVASIIAVMPLFGQGIMLFALVSVNVLSLISITLTTLFSLLLIREKPLIARFYLVSIVLMMAGVGMYVMRNLGYLPVNQLTQQGVKAGFLLQIMSLTFAVTERFRKLKQTTEKQLELQVKQRTHEIELKTEEIITQRDQIEAQRDIATRQRDTIANQNSEIRSSIEYAQYIQKSLLPSPDQIDALPGEMFVISKPCNIISGDFYSIKYTGSYAYVAVADCTGHGIPGALMSMLGVSFLNEFISDQEPEPSDILFKIRENIINTLHQSGKPGETHDGMHIGLVKIPLKSEGAEYTISYAGAYHDLYLLKKQDAFEVVKADRMPLAYYAKMEPFKNNTIRVKSGDSLYLFSDGITDQYGGFTGKKLSTKGLLQWLRDAGKSNDLQEQKQDLEIKLNRWMKDSDGNSAEQIDDITIFALRLS